MFEKDADYRKARKESRDNITKVIKVWSAREVALHNEGFKDGAEFGYNKANEWHKADVPTTPINKVVLGYIKDYNTKKFCLVKWNGEWWYDARTWNDKVKLIAWKEIVLPELPKEIE